MKALRVANRFAVCDHCTQDGNSNFYGRVWVFMEDGEPRLFHAWCVGAYLIRHCDRTGEGSHSV